jgi:hypothetical protein
MQLCLVIVVVYVDDIIITGSEVAKIWKVKSDLCSAFDITDSGLLYYCLGVEFWQTNGCVFVKNQENQKFLRDSGLLIVRKHLHLWRLG